MVAEAVFPVKPELPEMSARRESSQGESAHMLEISKTRPKCPNCQKSHYPGELACSYCGVMFTAGGKTAKIGSAATLDTPKVDLDSLEPTTPIIFDIGGKNLTLPLRNSLVVGRVSDLIGDVHPDVSLNDFDAAAHGISRQHIRITRKRDVVYIADLDSSNGTFLNGRRLTRNCYRVLNPGDEIQLGSLKFTIMF
jgi:hypothetical protein